jgi:hypothetical protein
MRPELRQFGTLMQADFVREPAWIQCHVLDYDEPWYDETTEETFRPWSGSRPASPSDGMLLVSSSFRLADGTALTGFITPAPGRGKVRDSDLGTVQPHIFLPSGKIASFWGGMFGFPDEAKAAFYDTLGKQSAGVFPIHFRADSNLTTGRQEGVIRGFYSIKRLGAKPKVSV